jgi:hypothetical protein
MSDPRMPESRAYGAQRVARAMVRALGVDEDPRTLALWSRAAGASVRSLQYWCLAAGVRPAACRDLTRLLRLVVGLRYRSWDPYNGLDSDPRTVRRLLSAGALPPRRHAPRPGVDAFLDTQGLVRSSEVLQALREQLASNAVGAKA